MGTLSQQPRLADKLNDWPLVEPLNIRWFAKTIGDGTYDTAHYHATQATDAGYSDTRL
jgi:hypothetical protein